MSNCKKCGNEFEPSKGLVSYCSLRCRNSRSFSEASRLKKSIANKDKHYVERKLINCGWCETEFKTIASRPRTYCSFLCKQRGVGRKGGLASSTSQNKRSKNEIYFSELCYTKFNDVITNQPIFNGWDADIIIPSIKLAILWNGIWHYKQITKSHSLKQVQNRDRIKLLEISKYGYTPYIIKDMGQYNKQFVETEFDKLIEYISKLI